MLKRFTNNWSLKLTALVLALVLWSHVRGQVNPLETAAFKVELRAEPPPGMVLLNAAKIPRTVKVTVRGSRLALRQLKGSTPVNPLAPVQDATYVSGNQMHARLDFTAPRKGAQDVPVKVETNLEDIEVINTKPDEIEALLDAAESRQFAIKPQFVPAPPDELRIENVKLSPSSAQVSGPSYLLARVAQVRARVQVKKLAPGLLRAERILLEAVDSGGKAVEDVHVEPPSVKLAAHVREQLETRSVRVTADVQGTPAAGYRTAEVEVAPSSITVQGTRRALDELDTLLVPIDIDGATGTVRRRVPLNLPAGIKAIDVWRVRVRVRIVPQRSIPPQPAPDGDGANLLNPSPTVVPPPASTPRAPALPLPANR